MYRGMFSLTAAAASDARENQKCKVAENKELKVSIKLTRGVGSSRVGAKCGLKNKSDPFHHQVVI